MEASTQRHKPLQTNYLEIVKTPTFSDSRSTAREYQGTYSHPQEHRGTGRIEQTPQRTTSFTVELKSRMIDLKQEIAIKQEQLQTMSLLERRNTRRKQARKCKQVARKISRSIVSSAYHNRLSIGAGMLIVFTFFAGAGYQSLVSSGSASNTVTAPTPASEF